ncbi:MAG: hypothetical protein IT513_14315 [Burkholderiales bacterium]|nr:hypothetical protein [Burkholderiales bacterium]
MANLSLRGLDAGTLARIRSSARRLRVSVNRLIIDTLQRQYAQKSRPRDQLDELAGTWSRREADEFEAAIRPFSEIDPELWARQDSASYRVRSRRKRR